MRRFNQAFLINPKDADLYYGFGAVYFNLGGMKQARKQYDKGLEIEPNHFEILTDYGTTYLGEYYNEINSDPSSASKNLDLALEKLRESYLVDQNYSSTTYKLSIVYLLKNDCENSRKFLDITKKIDSNVITQDYLNEFNLKCRNDKIDCSTIKTGNFRIDDKEIGTTLITRTDNFQIEENENLNYKLKLSITWLDECTYELKPVEDLINPNAELPTMIVTCHVTEINGNSYQQVSSSNESSIKISKEVEILN